MEVFIGYLTQIFSLKFFKLFWVSVVGLFSYLIGGIDVAVRACGLLVFFDFLFGLSIAIYYRKYSGRRMFEGLIKIILYGIAMIVGNQIDIIIFHNSVEFGAKNFIILYVGITDGISVIKHLGTMGLKLPQKLIERLQGLRDDIDIKT